MKYYQGGWRKSLDLALPEDVDVMEGLSKESTENITYLKIVVGFGKQHDDKAIEFFRNLGKRLPNLAYLQIENQLHWNRAALPLLALGELLLERADTMKDIETCGVDWRYASDGKSFKLLSNKLTKSLRQCGKLERVQLRLQGIGDQLLRFLLEIGCASQAQTTDMLLVESGPSARNMDKQMKFHKVKSTGLFEVDVVGVKVSRKEDVLELCNADYVGKVTCNGRINTGAIMNGLRSKEIKLVDFRLKNCLDHESGIRFFEALEKNETMHTLHLRLLHHRADDYYSRLAVAIQKLGFLERLVLTIHSDMPITSGFEELLTKNTCLQEFRLVGRFLSGRFSKNNRENLFERVIKRYMNDPTKADEAIEAIKNIETSLEIGNTTTLRKVCWQDLSNTRQRPWQPLFSKRGEFWLKLNAIGRKELLQQSDDMELWANTIINQKDDLSVVFYLLSKMPLLLIPEQTTAVVANVPSHNSIENVDVAAPAAADDDDGDDEDGINCTHNKRKKRTGISSTPNKSKKRKRSTSRK